MYLEMAQLTKNYPNKQFHQLKRNSITLFLKSAQKTRRKSLANFIKFLLDDAELRADKNVIEFLQLRKADVNSPVGWIVPRPASEREDDATYDLGATEKKDATADSFEFLKTIGKGHFGRVFLAKNKADGKFFAVKVLSKSQLKKKREISQVMCERNVLVKGLSHPFLCTLHFTFQSENKLFFVLDYINGGELFTYIQQEKTFSENRVKFYAAEMACALGYLHSNDIIYRDLKPENILLDSEGHIILTDFGLCKQNINSETKTSTFCGTPEYLAPEILNKEPYDFCVDWWCFGSVVYEMLHGLPPFYSTDHATMYAAILKSPLKLNSTCSKEVRDILVNLLNKNKALRMGSTRDVEELREHAFFADIDWRKLEARELAPPFKPRLSSAADTSNIATEFTRDPVSQSVIQSYQRVNRGTKQPHGDDTFSGFTYIEPMFME